MSDHEDGRLSQKAAGLAKEAVGRLTDDDDLEASGRAQQQRAQRDAEADRLEDEAAQKHAEAAAHADEERRRRP